MTRKQKIVITEFMDQAAVDSLTGDFEVVYDQTLGTDPERLFPLLNDADGLIVRTMTQVGHPLLDAGPNLQCVGRLGVGLDNFDLDACKQRGVPVFPSIGANALSVAEYVVTTASALLRSAYFRNADMIAGKWPRGDTQGSELSGKKLGIIGYGSIGRITADKLLGLGVEVCAVDPYVAADDPAWGKVGRFQTQKELMEWSDVVSLHVPLTPETRNLVSVSDLLHMKESGILINAARGGVVNEAALIEALRKGQIAGAALDVFENEPLSKEDGAKFEGVPNLILTPHIAGVTYDANVRVSAMTAENVRRALS